MSSLRMALLALVCTFSAHAQTATGTLSGLVRDQQGGVITNAQITVINSDKGVTRVAATNGEGLYSLTALDAGTYAGVGASAVPRLSFGGQAELNTLIQVDGVDNIQTFTGLPRATPSLEAASEFRVLNSTYRAEYGRALGGFVNIVTKSGGNQNHGSLYYFGENQELAARPTLVGGNPALRQNQYGATWGGPVVKDRTFFFFNYEGQRRAESNKFSQVILSNLSAINAMGPAANSSAGGRELNCRRGTGWRFKSAIAYPAACALTR